MTAHAYDYSDLWDDTPGPAVPTKEQQIQAAIHKHFPATGRVQHITRPQPAPEPTVAQCEICGERLAAELIPFGRHLLCGRTANETPDWSQ